MSLELSVTLAGFVAWCREHLLQQLLDLNRAVAAKVGAGDTATAPGLSPCSELSPA